MRRHFLVDWSLLGENAHPFRERAAGNVSQAMELVHVYVLILYGTIILVERLGLSCSILIFCVEHGTLKNEFVSIPT